MAKAAGTDNTVLTRSQKLTKAYGTASQILRTRHHPEFEELYVQEAAKLGEKYTPKQTEEQKAAAILAKIYEDFPHLNPAGQPPADPPDDETPAPPEA